MASINNFPGGLASLMTFIAGNTPEDLPTDQSNNMKMFSPMDHSSDGVSLSDLMFSPMTSSPNLFSQCLFPGGIDPGTPFIGLKIAGQTGGILLGQLNTVLNTQGGSDGGTSLLQGTPTKLMKTKIPVNVPPEIEEKEENGVKVRRIKEKGQEHSLSLLEGLPIHGALFPMTGFKLPEIKHVHTAKQHNNQFMDANMMQQLAGQIMSMSKMFQGLMGQGGSGGGGMGGAPPPPSTGGGGNTQPPTANTPNTQAQFSVSYLTPMERIIDSVPPEMGNAIQSMALLCQGFDTSSDTCGYFVGSVVHEETFLQNAEELLSQVQSLDDLMYTLRRLEYDTSLHGLDQLQSVTNTIDTAWGPATQVIDYAGEITINYSPAAMNAINAFANSITSNTISGGVGSRPPPSGGGGGGGGAGGAGGSNFGNMFGQSAKTMMDMFKRLSPAGEKEAKKLHQKLNESEEIQKIKKISKATVDGGKVTNPEYYDKGFFNV